MIWKSGIWCAQREINTRQKGPTKEVRGTQGEGDRCPVPRGRKRAKELRVMEISKASRGPGPKLPRKVQAIRPEQTPEVRPHGRPARGRGSGPFLLSGEGSIWSPGGHGRLFHRHPSATSEIRIPLLRTYRRLPRRFGSPCGTVLTRRPHSYLAGG